MVKNRVKTVFLMVLFCSNMLLSGCQAESTQVKSGQSEETENSEVPESNILLKIAEIHKKAEETAKIANEQILYIDEIYYGAAIYDWERQRKEDAMYLLHYAEIIQEVQKKEPDTLRYNLFYLDEDEMPELFLEKPECWVRIYTVSDGTVSLLLDEESHSDFTGDVRYYQYQIPYGVTYGGVRILKKSNENGDAAYCKMNTQGELESWYVVKENLSEGGETFYEHEGKKVPGEVLPYEW